MFASLLLAATIATAPAMAHRPVNTAVAEAQRSFDRALTDLFAYADGSAATGFYQARAADPHLAMADWGDALAEGSDLNTPLTELRFGRAHDATLRAQNLRSYASPQEAALIDAVTARYRGTYVDRASDERAYRDAMEKYVKTYPNDDDAAMLLVEALLEDHGVDWNDDGTPRGAASKEMLLLTNTVLDRNPQHLMANHLCIHIYDNAPNRDPAVACAKRLDAMTFAPQDEHLAHMPAHTWNERGDWRAATASSERAYQLVVAWASGTGQDITAAKYVHHDEVLALSAATLGGDTSAAAVWSKRLNEGDAHRVLSTGLKALRNGDRATAQSALASLRRSGPEQDTLILEARLDETDGKVDAALRALHRALDWQHDNFAPEILPLYPADDRIGAVQLRAHRYDDAERTFRAILKERPLAPRPLFGLWQTLLARGDGEEAATYERSFRAAWAGQYTLSIEDF
jgi:hypothetical protein